MRRPLALLPLLTLLFGVVALPAAAVTPAVVEDTNPPLIHLDPTRVVVEAPDTTAEWTATAIDTDPASPVVTCTRDDTGAVVVSGDAFPTGRTDVTCSATDAAGNSNEEHMHVIVADGVFDAFADGPTITVPQSSPDGAFLLISSFALIATSGADVEAQLIPGIFGSCERTSGTGPECSETLGIEILGWFPVGTTTYDLTRPCFDLACLCDPLCLFSLPAQYTDLSAADLDADTLTVTVTDTFPPIVTVPDDIEADGTGDTAVDFEASATDATDGDVPVECRRADTDAVVESGDAFPLGTTDVTCTATDAAENVGTASFSITVSNPGPTIEDATATAIAGWPVTVPLTVDDPNGDALTLTVPTAPSGSLATIEGEDLVFIPALGSTGDQVVEVEVCDGLLCATGTVTVTVSPFVAPDDAPTDTIGTLTVTPTDAEPGEVVTVTVEGAPAGLPVHFVLYSTPVALGTATADADGTVTARLMLPDDVAPGAHTVVAFTADGALDGDVTIVIAAAGITVEGLLLIALALLIGGTCMLALGAPPRRLTGTSPA